ncbi:MAG: Flp pilus assembly complex ATPase component TadA [Candidatus Omnitrophica bacterium]|nr:Flp pilus assembly complex ATPase component TadA [Candidatus Omnitrophota bacterium]MBU0878846.1 Flp pilus assembly complex ATPase component TadA [Candidatus Omnitrophota bacterium]MBU0896326.1 Flp pilus assembly complex ATPase component TadA [Candidatus Omnitrophota bacterium]MBU1133463.1 Flp pilus assembly complex ATPase component TadA [Candidatus Omnitrophota bacterium]MBU1367783.1 Flp pilus assembly complex ATPase component TadA [Candidatus Omnitrophota bacterium]
MPQYKRLGDILIVEGIITEEQLNEAISLQKKEGDRIGECLVKLGYISEEQIVIALSKQLSLPYISLSSGRLKPASDQNLEELIPHEFAIRNRVLPLSRSLNSLTVVVANPLDLILIDNLKKLAGCEINPVIATKEDLLEAIEAFYGKDKLFRDAMEAAGQVEGDIKEISMEETDLSLDKLIAQAQEAPIIKLVDLIIRQGIEEGASDIHLEPHHDKFTLRYRIDGVLYDMPSPSTALYLPIVSRVKILSRMDIAEKRLPQDGGFMVKMGDRLIDLRVSALPTIYGEKIVLRILDKARIPLELSKLGFLPNELELIRKGVSSSYGLVLLTGPTGSGKSTTLYAALNELKSSTRNTLTVEDPVEYRIEGINQVQVKADIGLTFANALRCFLRQDPDIILVGEVRDLETAEICIRSALTGHLVFSTLHTNDASSAVPRLIDIGIPSYLIVNSLRLIISQRLIKKLCPLCKQPKEVKKEEIPPEVVLTSPIIYRAGGCEKCNFIGYKGRSVITEIILVDEEIKEAIGEGLTAREIMAKARKKGTLTLLESGLKRVEEGTTSLEEILSVAIG